MIACTSRATPYIPKQSTLLEVGSSSITGSETGITSPSGVPGEIPSTSRTTIPAASSPISSSASERIIPSDSTPRSFALPSLVPSGITAPGSATGTVCPAATFGAPQTIVLPPSPASTSQTLSRSASGCCSTESTLPTTNPSASGAPACVMRSTSIECIARSSASSSTESWGSQYERSQELGALI